MPDQNEIWRDCRLFVSTRSTTACSCHPSHDAHVYCRGHCLSEQGQKRKKTKLSTQPVWGKQAHQKLEALAGCCAAASACQTHAPVPRDLPAHRVAFGQAGTDTCMLIAPSHVSMHMPCHLPAMHILHAEATYLTNMLDVFMSGSMSRPA